MSRNHEQLRVFHVADSLAVCVYRHSVTLPPEERFALQSQLRRAAVSAVTNVVEGAARRSTADYARFVDIALASATEADYLLTLAHRLGYLSPAAYDECRKLTEELLPSLQKLVASIEHFR